MSSSVLSGLSALKKTGLRRRVVEPDDLELEEEASNAPDFSNVANNTESNFPTPTAEGGIAPESFDVRANQIINPEEEAKKKHYEDVGRKLGMYASLNEAKTPQSAEMAPEERVLPSPHRSGVEEVLDQNRNRRDDSFLNRGPSNKYSKVGRGIKDYLTSIDRGEGFKPASREEIAQQLLKLDQRNEKYNLGSKEYAEENAPQLLEQENVQMNPGQKEENILAQEERQNEAIKIANQPENQWKVSVYGSADQIAQSPEFQREFTTITGQNWDQEVANQLKTYEEALAPYHTDINGVITQLSGDADRIRKRIESNQSTEMDKYYIGLTLALPLIIGGFFGAEAGLASFGGAAKGFGEAINKRNEAITNDEELLADINKKRSEAIQQGANLHLKQAELPQEIRKNLPKNPLAHLEGSKAIPYTDPDTGITSQAPEITNDLYVKPNFVNTPKKEEEKRKQAQDLAEVKTFVDGLDHLTKSAIDVISQLDDKTIVRQLLINALKGKDSTGLLSRVSQDVMIDGRKENAGLALNTIFGLIATKYANAYKLGQLDAAAQRHIHTLINNPESSFNTTQGAIHQLLIVNRDSQDKLIDSAKNQGFIPDIWKEQFDKNRNEVYAKLNKKAENKESERRKREAVRNQ